MKWLDEIMAGMNDDGNSEPESEAVKFAKETIDGLNLTTEEKAELAGWIVGDAIVDALSSAFDGKPTDE